MNISSETHTAPCVSVIIGLFNGGETIREALESIRKTGWPNLEVIVVDDGSRDDGPAAVRLFAADYPDLPVSLITHEDGCNHGLGASRNLGMKQSRGDYIAFLDADDTYYPNRLAAAVNLMENEPDVDAVFGRFDYIVQDTTNRGIKGGNRYDDSKLALDPLTLYLSGQSGACGITVTLRRRILETIGGFPSLRFAQDNAYWLRLFAAGRVKLSQKESVAGYRIHSNSWCSKGANDPRYVLGPVLARFDALQWFKDHPIPPERLQMIRSNLLSKLLTRYTRCREGSAELQRFFFRSMVRAARLHPPFLFNRNFASVLARSFGIWVRSFI